LLLFYALSLHSKEVCIENFNKKICANFQIMSSVIVKTKLSKSRLGAKIKKPFKQIAFLEDSNLFLIDTNNSLLYAKELSSKEFVIYAQPNILQQKENLKRKVQDITATYNLKNIWKKSRGEGIKIAIIDDGFNLNHEDLKDVNIAFEYDVEQKRLNSSPKVSIDRHGTSVAGIIFAQHNNIGIDGIAPNAEFIAIRQVSNVTSETILAFTIAYLAKADVINCSWQSPLLLEPIYDVIIDIVKRGRKGKGTAVVFAAGNNAKKILIKTTEASIPEVVVVAATQKYSNYGKFVDFTLTSGIKTTQKNTYGFFGGTSATAPIISGLLALKMSANKDLATKKIIKKLKEDLYER